MKARKIKSLCVLALFFTLAIAALLFVLYYFLGKTSARGGTIDSEARADKAAVKKGFLGICLNLGWPFFQTFEEAMKTSYAKSCGYYKDGELSPKKGMRPVNLMETYWQHKLPEDHVWKNGEDRNESAVILVISSHGCIEKIPNPAFDRDFYFWRYITKEERCIRRYDNECRNGDIEGESCRKGISKAYFINTDDESPREANCPNSALVKMGAKCVLIPDWPPGSPPTPHCPSGSGTTRWIVLDSCHAMDLDSPRWDIEFPWMLRRLWYKNDLNAGFRMIVGVSGSIFLNAEGFYFAYLQLKSGLPIKSAWFATTEDDVTRGKKKECTYVSKGKCVALAKGKNKKDCKYILNHDTFKNSDSIPPSEPGEDGWYICFSYKNCEPTWEDWFWDWITKKSEGQNSDNKYTKGNYEFYGEEIGDHEIMYAVPLTKKAGIYPTKPVSPNKNELISMFYNIMSRAMKVPLENLDTRRPKVISDKVSNVILLDDPKTREARWSFTYYKNSGKWILLDLKSLAESGAERGKFDPDFKVKGREEAKKIIDALPLKFGKNRVVSLLDIEIDPVETVLSNAPDKVVESLPDEEVNNLFETWVDYISIDFPLNLEGLYSGGKVEIYMGPDLQTPLGIIAKYRKVSEDPITTINLPDLKTLQSLAYAMRDKYCVGNLPCWVKLVVGYDDSDINTKKGILEPVVIISYDATQPDGDSEVNVITVPIRKIKRYIR